MNEIVWPLFCVYKYMCDRKKTSGLLEQEVQVALAFLCKYCEEYSDLRVEKYMLLTEDSSLQPL